MDESSIDIRTEDERKIQDWITAGNLDELREFLTNNPGSIHDIYKFNYSWEESPRPLYIHTTIMDYAVRRAPEIVGLLLELGADPNKYHGFQNPPIFSAVTNEPAFFALVDAGAELDFNKLKKHLKQYSYHDIPREVRKSILNEMIERRRKHFANTVVALHPSLPVNVSRHIASFRTGLVYKPHLKHTMKNIPVASNVRTGGTRKRRGYKPRTLRRNVRR